jgi:DNA invertase Pin-like site-specific DNA recombinase
MIAAIYARKSTEQNGVNEEEKSVTRQIEHAKDYAAKKGWTVAEDCIFVDDGVSGTEFGDRRPGFLRLMNALKPKPPFQVLILSEESRLGREQIKTAYALQQITDAGVQVWFYLTDQERKLNTAMDKMMASLTNFGSELERERISQRTHDAMLRKAKALYVTGCKVFGYDNVDVYGDERSPDGERKRLHVVRRVNETEAAVVRTIYERYASGMGGLRSLAKDLNAEGVLPPWGHRRGWDSSCIREILHRPLYRGLVIWNKTQAIQKDGTKKSRKRPESEWVKIEAPDLRIIPEAVIKAVDQRLVNTRALYLRSTKGKFFGHPSGADLRSAYLLSGLAMCAWCEGSLVGLKRGAGRWKPYYLCVRHHHRGAAICANDLRVTQDVLDEAVLAAVRRVFDPGMIREAIARAVEQLHASHTLLPDQRRAVERELSACNTRLAHLVNAIGTGKATEAVFIELHKQEARKKALAEQLERADRLASLSFLDAKRIERNLTERAKEITQLLGQHVPQTRQILRKLIPDEVVDGKRIQGRIVCTPINDARGKG